MQQKVLIIEDSASTISLLTKLVEMAQLKPVLATSLTAAKHIFIHSDPEDQGKIVLLLNYSDI